MQEKQKREEHRHDSIRRTILILEENNYKWISNLGSGAFGSVVELKNRSSQEIIAAKIVLEELITYSEVELWSSLSNQNVVPVISCKHVPQSRTYVFFMPKYRGSLDNILENSMLHNEGNGFERALAWLGGVLNGVLYLHKQKLCHLDLKLPNILINDSDMAVVTDFGSLTRTDAAANRYASPFIYRPPEALLLKNGKRIVVDGFKYDMYTIGALSTELFTKQMIWKTKKRLDPDRSWIDTMYPVIFGILEKKQFKKFVNATFLKSDVGCKRLENIRNFIIGCIMINPQNRPTVEKLLKHRLFRGSGEFKVKKKDVWQVRAPSNKINFLISLFIAQAAALRLPPNPSDSLKVNNEDKNVTNNQKPIANDIDRKHADETFDQTKVIKSNQDLELSQIYCKDASKVCDQPYIAINEEEQKTNKMICKYFSEVWDQLEIVENNHQTASNTLNHKDVNEVFDRLKIDTDNQTPKLINVDHKDISEASIQLKIIESKSNDTDRKDFDEVLDPLRIDTDNQAPRLINVIGTDIREASVQLKIRESKSNETDLKDFDEDFDRLTIQIDNQAPKLNNVDDKDINEASAQLNIRESEQNETNREDFEVLDETQGLSQKINEVSNQPQSVSNNQKLNKLGYNDIDEIFDQQKVATNSQKLKHIDEKDVNEIFAQRMIVAKNQEPETNKMDFKNVDEIFDQQKIIKNSQKPEPNEISLKEMPDQEKNIANNPEPELNKMHRTDVNEVFQLAKIYSNNQKSDNEDNNKTPDWLKIDSNSQESKPNYIKHDPDVVLTRRQRILEWGRRTKYRVTKAFNRLLKRPVK